MEFSLFQNGVFLFQSVIDNAENQNYNLYEGYNAVTNGYNFVTTIDFAVIEC